MSIHGKYFPFWAAVQVLLYDICSGDPVAEPEVVTVTMSHQAGSGTPAWGWGGAGRGRRGSGRGRGGRSWSSRDRGSRRWGGRSWSGRSWGGRNWSGRSWSGRSWCGRRRSSRRRGGRVVEVTFLSGQVGTHLVPWQPDSARGTLEQHQLQLPRRGHTAVELGAGRGVGVEAFLKARYVGLLAQTEAKGQEC